MSRTAALVASALTLVCAGAAGAATPIAPGSPRLVHALESSPATVIGTVSQPRQVDAHGWTAQLEVESAVVGDVETGTVVPFAWEKLARSAPQTFREGDRILVSLERLPGDSIWRTRFPDGEERSRILHVANRGHAFLHDPTVGGALVLQHYARLGREGRTTAAGAGQLVQLASGAQPRLALSAIDRLSEFPGLDGLLSTRDGDALVATLLRPDASEGLKSAIEELLAQRRLESARPALEREAARDAEAEPVVFSILGRLDGELSPERSARLLTAAPPGTRAAAARYASGPDADTRLRKALAADPEAVVRAAAVERLVALEGQSAIPPAVDALRDRDDEVRHAAARALGTLGVEAVPHLRDVVDDGSQDAAKAALAGLLHTGTPEAEVELREIAETHEDPGIRLLAKIATGQEIGDTHDAEE